MNRVESKTIRIPSHTRYIRKAVDEVLTFVRARNIDDDELPLILSEALANSIIHGNKNDAKKKVMARVTIEPEKMIIQVADEGAGFDYQELHDPRRRRNLMKVNGRGNFLIRCFTDEVHYNHLGNEITMIKYIM